MAKLFSIVGALAFCGCSNVTAENYEGLKVGMVFEEVTGLLGSPAECGATLGFTNCRWGDDAAYIRVNFVGDQVAVFSSKNVR